jgi:hypothetical protein
MEMEIVRVPRLCSARLRLHFKSPGSPDATASGRIGEARGRLLDACGSRARPSMKRGRMREVIAEIFFRRVLPDSV